MAVDIGVLIEVTGNVLLFILVFGMSATVEIRHIKDQLKNVRAISTGLLLQFVAMPLLGFLVVKMFNLDRPTGVTLLVLASSPGGSYSNWYDECRRPVVCSFFRLPL